MVPGQKVTPPNYLTWRSGASPISACLVVALGAAWALRQNPPRDNERMPATWWSCLDPNQSHPCLDFRENPRGPWHDTVRCVELQYLLTESTYDTGGSACQDGADYSRICRLASSRPSTEYACNEPADNPASPFVICPGQYAGPFKPPRTSQTRARGLAGEPCCWE